MKTPKFLLTVAFAGVTAVASALAAGSIQSPRGAANAAQNPSAAAAEATKSAQCHGSSQAGDAQAASGHGHCQTAKKAGGHGCCG